MDILEPMSTDHDLLSRVIFADYLCKFMTGEMVQMASSKLVVGGLIFLLLSVYGYLGLVVKYWPIDGTFGCHTHSKHCHLNSFIEHYPTRDLQRRPFCFYYVAVATTHCTSCPSYLPQILNYTGQN